MSTGQTSASFAASAGSEAVASSTSIAMNVPSLRIRAFLRADLLADHLRDVLDPLGDRDAGAFEALDLLGRRVLLALDDRARVPEAHAGHLVHEAAGHERDDRQ